MARARAERTKSKASLIEDLTSGIGRLQEFIPQIEDLGREGFPYLEGARARTELQLRECIRKTFGEKSPEFQHYKQHKLSMESPADTKKSVGYIKTLIAALDDKKQELLGLKPPPPPAEPPAPTPEPKPKPQMTLVPPAAPVQPTVSVPPAVPTAQVTITSVAPAQPPPVTMSVALSTNLDLVKPPSPVTPSPVPSQPAPTPVVHAVAPPQAIPPVAQPSMPAPAAMQRETPAPTVPATPPVSPQPAPLQPTVAPELMIQKPAAPRAPEPVPMWELPPTPDSPGTGRVHRPTPPASEHKAEPETPKRAVVPSPAPQAVTASPSPSDPVEIVKTLCRRFHLIARQLRLRGEYRATLDVEDEFDVQDLLHALLRLHFDDIETAEWVPSYANGSPRIMFLLNDGRLGVVVKKTRTGLNAKDLAEQLRVDAEYCRTLKRCSTLLCFVYDPEGRIGNPRGLEADLISISDQLTTDVFVSPK